FQANSVSSEQRLRGQKEAWSDDCNQLVFHAWNCSTSMKLGKVLACIVLIGDYHLRYGISVQRSLAERVRLESALWLGIPLLLWRGIATSKCKQHKNDQRESQNDASTSV
ncbi:MAG: hypothetical protein OSA89_17605, partial [Mariniblastus sp.]|nr:hypothetical protein [Mariniblastus sp.]